MRLCFLWNCWEVILESYTLYWIQLASKLSQKQRRILACFNNVFNLVLCESISKMFYFSRTAKKKTSMRSNNAAVSGSIAARLNFMSDCKQMQVCLKNGKAVHQPKTKNIRQTYCKIGLNYVGESSRKFVKYRAELALDRSQASSKFPHRLWQFQYSHMFGRIKRGILLLNSWFVALRRPLL